MTKYSSYYTKHTTLTSPHHISYTNDKEQRNTRIYNLLEKQRNRECY